MHWEDLSIGFGTSDSLTGCMIIPDPHFWKPHPAGYERKGLLCGNTGDFVAVSVSELMANASTMPASLTVKICSKEIPSDTLLEAGTILVPSSELKCFANDDMGLILRGLPWFKANFPILSTLPLAEVRCVAYKRWCHSTGDGCTADDVGTSKTILTMDSATHCEEFAKHPEVYADLKCCSTHGCNFDPTPPAPAALGPPPKACQVIGVQVSTAIEAINATSNCDGAGKCYNMTELEMKLYVGTPRMVPLQPHHFSCIDGRHDDEIVATPAGDMGIFLSSAYVYIRSTATPMDFSLVRIKTLLADFIRTFRTKTTRFYYHTDEHTLEETVQALKTDYNMSANLADKYLHVCNSDFVPPEEEKAHILKVLTSEHGIGCGHVKYMLLYPEQYGLVSADLVKYTIQALWELKWGELREYIKVEPLGHNHTEMAVLSITHIDGCDGFTPLITQRTAAADGSFGGADAYFSGQIFANHDHSVKVVRNKVADYFIAKNSLIDSALFRANLDNLADSVQLMESARRLARYRPLYNATVKGQLYTPDYWNGTVPSGSLYCYVGTSKGLVLRDAYAAEEADLLIGPDEPRCVRFVHLCTQANAYCTAGERGAVKTVVDFATQADCDAMAMESTTYRGLLCCSTHGCNYKPVTGPSAEVLGAPPAMACQFLGMRVGTLAPIINANSSCDDKGNCYPMTPLQMKEYIGSPAMVPLEPNHFSCIDGRHDDEIVATPAGDMGIFLSSAYIYVNRTATPHDFSVPRLKELLSDFIRTFRSKSTRFYYHTDEHTLKHLVSELKNRSMDVGEADRYMDVCDAGFSPLAGHREMVLQLLSDPKHGIGCGHVKYMAENPADYGITNGTFVTNTVRALWELKWGELRDYINVDPLGHEHTEQAVLSITSIEGCPGFTPLITQRTPEADGPPGDDALYAGQIFANHDYSVKLVRNKVATYYTRMGGMTGSLLSTEAFRKALDTLADDKQLMASAKKLAKHRPYYNATIVGKTYIPDYRRRLRRRLRL